MKVMITIRATDPPDLDELKQRYGLADSEVDSTFGVIEIDPQDQLFAFMVEEDRAGEISMCDRTTEGPFSNPPIQPFGPPDLSDNQSGG